MQLTVSHRSAAPRSRGLARTMWSAGTPPMMIPVMPSRWCRLVYLGLVCSPLLFSACGAAGEEPLALKHLETNVTASPPVDWSHVLRGPAYTGKLAVMFKEGTGVRLVEGKLVSTTGTDLRGIQRAVESVPSIQIARALAKIPDEQIQTARANAVAKGRGMPDWSLLYELQVADPTQAEQVVHALASDPSVAYVHPWVRGTAAGPTTPNLYANQGYVEAEGGGLNIAIAWEAPWGLTGNGVTVVDVEASWWNFAHEDLGLTQTSLVTIDQYTPIVPFPATDPAAQHGTAVVGILNAKDNSLGVRGIAPQATVQLMQTGFEAAAPYYHLIYDAIAYETGQPTDFQPGTVVLEEFQLPDPNEQWGTCKKPTKPGEIAEGCVPIEAYETSALAIKSAIAHGIVVVEVAGNSGKDLSYLQDTGAIMVGASTGTDMEKLPASNCGSRVNVYAWGEKVVSTGYGDLGYGTNPDQWYTVTFGGTSAAGAQIAGVAALLQEYFQTTYGAGLKPWQTVYLTSAQMRDVLVQSGAGREASKTNGCPIGVQPDVGKALQLLKDGSVKPKPYEKGLSLCLTQGWCEQWCAAQTLAQISAPHISVCSAGLQAQWCALQDPAKAPPLCMTAEWCKGLPLDQMPEECLPVLLGPAWCKGLPLDKMPKECLPVLLAPTWCNSLPTGEQPKECIDYIDTTKLQGRLAKPMDMDGDERADLITWSRDHKWYVDLSHTGSSEDNYGSWDLIFTPAPLPNGMWFPVVTDYNTDGQADLALYDAVTGKWYIAYTYITYTDAGVLIVSWQGWDKIIDYSKAAGWMPYSRPVPGDYDGADHCGAPECAPFHGENPLTFDRWMDPALATPDGHLLIDVTTQAEGQTSGAVAGTFDHNIPYLSSEQLDAAPGWAYLPLPDGPADHDYSTQLAYAVPPGLPDWSSTAALSEYVSGTFANYDWFTYWADPSAYLVENQGTVMAQKEKYGQWALDMGETGWIYETEKNFGETDCRPIRGDYDKDGTPDRAVVCPDEWRIAYSDPLFPRDSDELRHVPLTGSSLPYDPLPGYVYPGGTAYDTIVETYKLYNYGCKKSVACTPHDLTKYYPPPIGPYFPLCFNYWAHQPVSCLGY